MKNISLFVLAGLVSFQSFAAPRISELSCAPHVAVYNPDTGERKVSPDDLGTLTLDQAADLSYDMNWSSGSSPVLMSGGQRSNVPLADFHETHSDAYLMAMTAGVDPAIVDEAYFYQFNSADKDVFVARFLRSGTVIGASILMVAGIPFTMTCP